MPYLSRMITLLASMIVDTIVGVTLMMTPGMPFPAYIELGRTWGLSPTQDLHWGGAMTWVGATG